jgi:hypothetical protein
VWWKSTDVTEERTASIFSQQEAGGKQNKLKKKPNSVAFSPQGNYTDRSRKPRLTAEGIRYADHTTPSIRKSWQ